MAQSKGRGFAAPNLYRFVQFYNAFPEIFSTPSRKSEGLLTWSHYTELLRVTSKEARDWYETEAAAQSWSVRALQRNIDNKQLFASKYQLCLPGEEELRAEVENQKTMFALQHGMNGEAIDDEG